MTSPDDQDDVPFCDSHWEEYHNKKQKLLEELYKYYTQPERSKREDMYIPITLLCNACEKTGIGDCCHCGR